MHWLGERIRPATQFLLVNPLAVGLLAAAYAAAGIALVATDYTLNNEGLLTHYWASWARQEPLATFYFQKVKPALAAAYAPVAGGGPHRTMAVHVLVAAAAVPMLAATARALGQSLPNFAALAVALSPVYFFGGPAGISNVDGAVGICLVLYLLAVRRWSFAAGLVAGLLPWVRFEIVPFCAFMALFAVFTAEHRRFLAGLAIFPAAYAVSGAFYHGDPLWMLSFPGSAPFDPANPIYRNQRVGLRYLLEPMAMLTPVAGLVAALAWARLQRLEKFLLAYLVFTAVIMNLMQILRLGNFGDAPRYMLHLLPPIALLLGRTLEPWWRGGEVHRGSLLAAALLVTWVASRQHGALAVVLFAPPMSVLAAAWRGAGTAAVALSTAFVLAGPLLPLRTTLTRPEIAAYLEPMAGWLTDNREQLGGAIYTNAQLLSPYLRDRLPNDIYFMAGFDTEREITGLTNPANRQREKIRGLCAEDLYGQTLMPPFPPERLPAGAILALRRDPRLSRILPDEVWARRLEVLVEHPEFRIARVIRR